MERAGTPVFISVPAVAGQLPGVLLPCACGDSLGSMGFIIGRFEFRVIEEILMCKSSLKSHI